MAVIAAEFAWFLFVGPIGPQDNAAAAHAAQQTGDQNYPWWQYSGAWVAIFTIVLTVSTVGLWISTRQSVRVSERALTELERAHVFCEIAEPGITLEGLSTNQPSAQFRTIRADFFNIGRSPAFLTNMEFAVTHVPVEDRRLPTNYLPKPIDPTSAPGRELPVGIVVHNERKHSETLNMFTFAMQLRFEVARGEQAVWAYGFVRYLDSLGKRYITGFCFIFDGISQRFVQWGDNRYNYAHEEKASDVPRRREGPYDPPPPTVSA